MKLMIKLAFGGYLLFGLISCQSAREVTPPEKVEISTWQEELRKQLPLLGHRNWILVVDKAFPVQTAPGMDYIYADENLLPVLEHVLEQLKGSTHVKPVVFRDQELGHIT